MEKKVFKFNPNEELKNDIKFLYALVPNWVKVVPEKLDPTFYGTGSYDEDLKIKCRVDEIVKKYLTKP